MLVYKNNLDKLYQYLIIFLGLLMPLTVSGAKIVASLVVLIWLLTGNYKEKILKVINNPIAKYSLLFFSIHLVGLLWTEDMVWGLHIVKKMIDFGIFLPVFLVLFYKDNIRFYIGAFLISIVFTQILSLSILFEFIEPFKNASLESPTPFMSSISHGPFMAFAFYLFSRLVYSSEYSWLSKSLFFLLAMLSVVGIFTTNGRAGQVVYFVLIFIMFFQHYGLKLKTFSNFFYLSLCTVILALSFSPVFKDRVSMAISEVNNFNEKSLNAQKGTSVGLRLAMAQNSFEIIKKDLIFGVGTGDFKNEYSAINKINSPELPATHNPHNMYILLLSQLGLIGLISLLVLFLKMILISRKMEPSFAKDIGLALPVLFLIINFSDSYLLGHFTTFLFIYFSAIVFSDSIDEKNTCNNSEV